jgi:hypothetical protein
MIFSQHEHSDRLKARLWGCHISMTYPFRKFMHVAMFYATWQYIVNLKYEDKQPMFYATWQYIVNLKYEDKQPRATMCVHIKLKTV